ncbi:MAG: hypothetical protein U0768_22960 [Anaerolineae bacterium]
MDEPPTYLQSPPGYHSFLVRLWRESAEGPWRASAHCVQTGETLRFASVEALFAYLVDRVGVPSDTSTSPQPSEG